MSSKTITKQHSSNCEEDVSRIKKKLEKMMKESSVEASQCIDMLNVLKGAPISLPILESTRIGVVVNNLRRSSSNEELGVLAKNLLKSWKKLVPSKGTNGNTNDSPTTNFDDNNSNNTPLSPPPPPPSLHSQTSSNSLSRNNSLENGSSSSSLNAKLSHVSVSATAVSLQNATNTTPASSGGVKRPFSSFAASKITFSETNDPKRVKSRELLAAALKPPQCLDNLGPTADPMHIAARCEDVIFNEFKALDAKYVNRIRSRFSNLKDLKNPKLRENVLLQYISPDRLAVMSADEMASDELKQLREKFTKEAIDDHAMAVATGGKSSLLKCRKCKSDKCGYNEMQTRSADEPMTVFAYCLDCGHRWKQ